MVKPTLITLFLDTLKFSKIVLFNETIFGKESKKFVGIIGVYFIFNMESSK
jgi:hypothetical protein